MFRYLKPFQVGAVLALTSAAELEELDENVTLQEHIVKYAELLYLHANSVQRIAHHEALYIISGCIRSENWALAAFRHPMVAPDDTLKLARVAPGGSMESSPKLQYKWTEMGSAEARRGGSKTQREVKDQSLFLRGFKLDMSQPRRARLKLDSDSHSTHFDQDSKKPSPDAYDPSSGSGGDSGDAGPQGQRPQHRGLGGSGTGSHRTAMAQSLSAGEASTDRSVTVANAQADLLTLCFPPVSTLVFGS